MFLILSALYCGEKTAPQIAAATGGQDQQDEIDRLVEQGLVEDAGSGYYGLTQSGYAQADQLGLNRR